MMGRRNYNLDVLRCLAMFLVVMWHFYYHGMRISSVFAAGVLTGGMGLANYWLSQWLVIVCSACVNLFVLISGYFLVGRPFNGKRVILLWLEVFFYGTVIALLFSASPVLYLFPIGRTAYWFVPSYVGLVCLAPFLSSLVAALTRPQYKRLLLVLTLLGCTLTMGFPFGDAMGASKGFSLIWFVVLFFFGGYIQRFPVRMSARTAFLACLGVSVAAMLLVLVKTLVRQEMVFEKPAYNSFGFFIALFLFIGFRQKKETAAAWAKGLSWCAPYVFAVYLISEHPLLRRWLWGELVDWRPLINHWWFIPAMLGAVAAVFVLCVLVDYGRAWLFKLVGLERAAQWLGDRGVAVVNRIVGDTDK